MRHELDDMDVVMVQDPADVKKMKELEAQLEEAFKGLGESIANSRIRTRRVYVKSVIVYSTLTFVVGIATGMKLMDIKHNLRA